ncbi:MAG: hypothetical protein KZQ93_12045 [Candidatus Thiodiazotropha sp. (ex Monitilora ramsayi)]|nr:hypothetical protein [Candidatus Thiodiazotropha sp. (ex Monitilora ramsayi)]
MDNKAGQDVASRWLPPLALLPLLSLAGLIALGMVALSLWLSLQQPWLGVEARPDPAVAAWVVTGVAEAASTAGFEVGDQIVAVAADGHTPVRFEAGFAVEDPETLPDFQTYNRFFERQDALFRVLLAERIELQLADGRVLPLSAAPARPWSTLPLPFWIVNGFALFCILMGVGIWGHRRGRATTRLLVLGSIGILLTSATVGVYGFREFALSGELFAWLHRINRFGVYLWVYSMVTLLWFYPRPISRLPAAQVVFLLASLLCLNELLQGSDWPLHTFYLPGAFTPFGLGLVLASLQWRRSRGLPLDRAAMRLFLISVLLTSSIALTLYAAPPMVGQPPLVPLWVGHLSMNLVYGGFAVGVLRYRLFDVEWWWLLLWRWFFVAVAFLATDLALLAWFNLQPMDALGLSVVLVAWLYIPLRQWGWKRLFGRKRSMLEDYLPQFLEAQFSQIDNGDGERAWLTLLRSVFRPLSLERVDQRVDDTRLVDNGLMLQVPDSGGRMGWLLSGKHRGVNLFDRHDCSLAEGLLNLTRQARQLRMEKEQAAERERQRIARDLHDDVGAQLLTVIHGAESTHTAKEAQEALRALRESIYALRQEKPILCRDLLADWRHEVLNRLEVAGVELRWHDEVSQDACFVTGRQRINLTRMLREAVSNLLRHGAPNNVGIAVTHADGNLELQVNGDAVAEPVETWREGAGMAGIRSRAGEIGAHVAWQSDDVGTKFILTMLLDAEIENEKRAPA